MTMNDLTAPLGQDPNRHRRAINLSVGKIIAVALGLFFGAFVLWAVIAQDRSGGEPMAVAPADLRFAKKGTEVVAVPQATAPADSKEPATTAALRPSPPAKQFRRHRASLERRTHLPIGVGVRLHQPTPSPRISLDRKD